MQKQEEIRERYESGETKRQISREMKLSQDTVRKYAEKAEWQEEEKIESTYKSPTIEPYRETIEEWLIGDKKEPRKQRHTIKRIYERLRNEKKYTGSYPTVKRYVKMYKIREKMKKEGYMPLEHVPGQVQLDFGEVKYYDGNGAGQKGYELVMSFVYSNKGGIIRCSGRAIRKVC
jgi:hypothetical protein